jgi:hypothetical protein
MPSLAAGRGPQSPRSVTFCFLELYHGCVDHSGWAGVLFEAPGGTEKLSFTHRLPPTAHPLPPPTCQPGRKSASERTKEIGGGRKLEQRGGPAPFQPQQMRVMRCRSRSKDHIHSTPRRQSCGRYCSRHGFCLSFPPLELLTGQPLLRVASNSAAGCRQYVVIQLGCLTH